MGEISVAEHRKIFWIIFLLLLAFSSCNHIVRSLRLPPTAESPSLKNFAINFNAHVIGPLDDARINFGRTVAQTLNSCPDAVQGACSTVNNAIQLIFGLS